MLGAQTLETFAWTVAGRSRILVSQRTVLNLPLTTCSRQLCSLILATSPVQVSVPLPITRLPVFTGVKDLPLQVALDAVAPPAPASGAVNARAASAANAARPTAARRCIALGPPRSRPGSRTRGRRWGRRRGREWEAAPRRPGRRG